MKSSATSKNDISLIAGSGYFAYESAMFLKKINRLNKIYLINENKIIDKKFANSVIKSDIRNIELLINTIKKENFKNVLIVGYVELPPFSEIKLSFLSKIYFKKNLYSKSINDQSLILKNFLVNKKINLLSQKKILKDFLLQKNNQIHNKIIKKI